MEVTWHFSSGSSDTGRGARFDRPGDAQEFTSTTWSAPTSAPGAAARKRSQRCCSPSPYFFVAIPFLGSGTVVTSTQLARLGLDLFLLGPGAGIAVGLLGTSALEMIRRKTGVLRDYESIYSLGIAFTPSAAAEAVHGSGFLAAL